MQLYACQQGNLLQRTVFEIMMSISLLLVATILSITIGNADKPTRTLRKPPGRFRHITSVLFAFSLNIAHATNFFFPCNCMSVSPSGIPIRTSGEGKQEEIEWLTFTSNTALLLKWKLFRTAHYHGVCQCTITQLSLTWFRVESVLLGRFRCKGCDCCVWLFAFAVSD